MKDPEARVNSSFPLLAPEVTTFFTLTFFVAGGCYSVRVPGRYYLPSARYPLTVVLETCYKLVTLEGSPPPGSVAQAHRALELRPPEPLALQCAAGRAG
jgi:hypothetical protein